VTSHRLIVLFLSLILLKLFAVPHTGVKFKWFWQVLTADNLQYIYSAVPVCAWHIEVRAPCNARIALTSAKSWDRACVEDFAWSLVEHCICILLQLPESRQGTHLLLQCVGQGQKTSLIISSSS
jgi:hypothetical protein